MNAQRRPKRDKIFGLPAPRRGALCRETRARLMFRARAIMNRREEGSRRHWGEITPKMLRVFEVLLFEFGNGRTGLCFPGYDRIAQRAGVARSTVALAVAALERCGLLTWQHRLQRVRIEGRLRVMRTSNAYAFPVLATESESRAETKIQDSSSSERKAPAAPIERNEALERALAALKRGISEGRGS